ncbi:uncharacterized protein LOC130529002 isoform X2 [Takifugu flavidus]|uniref:uncharacterized protein LOC130529002 isoform X2 n=1 Tax=Takifugu flavidus TaxID=433684 RepID=UPI0025447748|nr:uncharacterized protein LOC130529002 isoform X2 [Takifugu flavidus]
MLATPVTPEFKWIYIWGLPHSESSVLLQWAKGRVGPAAHLQTDDAVHCTAHVAPNQDTNYEERFYAQASVQLTTDTMYWDPMRCAASVNLSACDCQLVCVCVCQLFDVPSSTPHISLAKGPEDCWKDLGSWVKLCRLATDWEDTSNPYVQYSPSLQVHSMSHLNKVPATPTVIVVRDCLSLLSHAPSSQKTEFPMVPDHVWAAHKYDVGLVKNCEPLIVTPKSGYRPRRAQYPLRKEAIEGIQPVFDSLLAAGVIVPCPNSPVNSPILPVKKYRPPPAPEEWRFVQDLTAVNAAVQPRAPLVPNPYTILSTVPPDATWFSVIDLSNAFFSVPVHPDSQFWFAFQFRGKGYTFTRMPQGYCESPTIYNQCLGASLASLQLQPGSALLQYVDDLLLCAPTKSQCTEDTITLLQHLATEGHKVSQSKMQYVQTEVAFLGHRISKDGKALSDKHIQAIQRAPRPVTVKELLSFIGLCSYCRAFVPNFSERVKPLNALSRSLSMSTRIQWTVETEAAFTDLKLALQSPPTLGLPDPERQFIQTVDERHGCMTSVLLQEHGGALRPVAYFSCKLDPVAAALPHCLRAIAAAEKAVVASRDLVGYSPLTLLVPHMVTAILHEQRTSHLSAARYIRYHTHLLGLPNVTVKRCNVLNPATLLPTPEEGDPHDCMAELSVSCSPRPDLMDQPLINPDLVLFVDGSASRDADTGRCKAGYAVCDSRGTVESASLPSNYSAQAAELVALTRACHLAANQSVTIFTDSSHLPHRRISSSGARWGQSILNTAGWALMANHACPRLFSITTPS